MIDLVLHEGHEWQPVGPESPLTRADATSNCVVKLRSGGIYYGPAEWRDLDQYRFSICGQTHMSNGSFYGVSVKNSCDIVAIVRGTRPKWLHACGHAIYGNITATSVYRNSTEFWLFEDNGKTVTMPREEARKRIEEIWGERAK